MGEAMRGRHGYRLWVADGNGRGWVVAEDGYGVRPGPRRKEARNKGIRKGRLMEVVVEAVMSALMRSLRPRVVGISLRSSPLSAVPSGPRGGTGFDGRNEVMKERNREDGGRKVGLQE
jgi:hypothetical protein